ncbi:MAG: hypothetical protein NZZ60_05415 [Bacteroidia bacterium]|nr:hypothetical protein [Bacteroidia bacterium]
MRSVIKWIGLLGSYALYSQPLDAPKPFYWGGSWGIGGVHLWARPALALRYNHTFLHCSPIPAYFSLGVSHPVGYFRRKERYDRPLYLGLHIHQRYLPGRELRWDTRLIGLIGVRIWLEPYLQRFYMQVGVGMQAQRVAQAFWRITPTGEIQIGGFYRPHKYIPKRLHRESIENW